MPASILALGTSDVIQLTTFRCTGEGVPTPVWVVPGGDGLSVSTPGGTGRLKRLAHTSRVTVAECRRRGTVADGVTPVDAVATVTSDPDEADRVGRLLADRYAVQFTLFMLVERFVVRGDRRREVIRIVPAPPAGRVGGE